MFKRFFAITENILADVAQIDIHISTHKRLVRVCQEWVHQPELNILNISLLEISVIQLTHNTTPTRSWIRQFTITTYLLSRDVVWSTFFWIVTQVQRGQNRICIRQHLFIWINLLLIHNTSSMI